MTTAASRQMTFQILNVAVGTCYFLIALLLFFYRLLGAPGTSQVPFWMAGVLGVATAVVGVAQARGPRREEKAFGTALAIEGVVLVVLILLAWVFGAPTLLPPA